MAIRPSWQKTPARSLVNGATETYRIDRRRSEYRATQQSERAAGISGFFVRYHRGMDYQAKLKTPFGVLGIRCSGEALTGIDFLPPGERPQHAATAFATVVCEQLRHYLENPNAKFSMSLELHGTPHQQKVWQAMLAIPRGQTRSYGEIAAELKSCAQAVGQACGANPIPVIVPCHRVVGRGGLGGFAHHRDGTHLDIKRWLLRHEGAL